MIQNKVVDKSRNTSALSEGNHSLSFAIYLKPTKPTTSKLLQMVIPPVETKDQWVHIGGWVH